MALSTTRFTTFIILAIILSLTAGCGVAKNTQLQVKIKDALSADRNVQADKLTVNVMEGIVTISGELYTQEEIDLVIEIVSAIDGVIEVKDHMSLPDNYNAVNPSFLDPF